ncbi:E3 ubiquitin/ISG15 ligase TRIM25-like [Anomaloglossus baeobatrachus]|uniref:E3 ubiquitin/ISG15 ligase TRIM25-like n=1 Tax=Anomaloglossus baeobatrachus TaxID=238106 RepID=UPI003F509E3B
MAFAALKDELACSICLNIFSDPVLLTCGHNFCRVCIDRVLESQEETELYSCPDCRREYLKRPALQSNLKLCNIAETYHSTQPAQPETEIFCSSCIHAPVPAVICCLNCEVSLCENHLRVHSKSQEHVLMEPSCSLRMKKCPSHQKALVYYCCDEKSCICVSCLLNGEHREHQVININEASGKKMDKLRSLIAKGTLMRDDVDEKIQTLHTHNRDRTAKFANLTEFVNITFKEISRQLDVITNRVLGEIARQKEKTSLSISDLNRQLDGKRMELSRKMRHMEKLCNSADPLNLLHDQKTDGNYFADLKMTDLYERVDKITNSGDIDESWVLKMVDMGLSEIMDGVGQTKYFPANKATAIWLDINSASNNICVSGDLKTVSCAEVHQNRPETPERFDNAKILSTRSFTSGRHYWDMDTCKSGGWRVGVAYANVERRGPKSFIGNNMKSLGLRRDGDKYSIRHNGRESKIDHTIVCEQIRIDLNYDAGKVSFYELSDPITHIHTSTIAFTQPLHAVFGVYENGWIRLRN